MTPGVCIWLTGRSGTGKSTLTGALVPMLEDAGRTVTVLDVVPFLQKAPGERTSEGKLLRKAYVAGEVARHGGIAICVTVSARRRVREGARTIVGADRFLEVLVEAPTDVSEARRAARTHRPPWRKRVRHRLRRTLARLRPQAAGGYEEPTAPDLRVDTTVLTIEEGAEAVLGLLRERGIIVDPARPATSVSTGGPP